jgi:probable phosphoglycerate mutase
MPVYFGLIRHAQTVMNLAGKIQGQLDSPLTNEGILMARKWGKSLTRYKWDLILSSDLGRAVETAQLINESINVPLIVLPDLREQSWGRWSGLTLDEIYRTDKAYLDEWDFENDWNYEPPDGESRLEVIYRAQSILRHYDDKNKYNRILVVTHAGVMRFIFLKLLNKNFSPESIDYIQSNTINWLTVDDSNNFRAVIVNELI